MVTAAIINLSNELINSYDKNAKSSTTLTFICDLFSEILIKWLNIKKMLKLTVEIPTMNNLDFLLWQLPWE